MARREQIPWYLNAVFYGVDVSKFADGNGDGVGVLVGLTEKLPYIKDLGATCLWLLPFFATPDRDNGYDVRDYYLPDPSAGTLDDFIVFLRRAGEHGLKVIIDLVVNHTSDEHPWFAAARRDPKSRFRDYYIWSEETPPVDLGEISALPGDEDSVWTYDDVAGAYYFHKFRHFQPDLNTANPEVKDEIMRIIDYWTALGVNGFRVDAAPFVIGEKGYVPAPPRQPQGLLRTMHDVLRSRDPEAILLGEVNMPPDRLAEYFGRGNQLGLLYNFNLTSFMFLALARGEAEPIRRCLASLPVPPRHCGWANFLRSLDELSFSRLAPDEREEAFAAFGPDPSMRIYDRGVRRRLAPLLGGNQARIEMAFSLLLSMPGAPLLAYGDEIGLGEDLSAEGRDAVRGVMQWHGGRNGGFSTAPASRVSRPLSAGGRYGFRRVNVAAQEADSGSLLQAVKQLIRWRRSCEVIGRTPCRFLDTGHPAVLAHRYRQGGDSLVVLHNLGGKAATARLDLDGSAVGTLADLATGEALVRRRGRVDLRLAPYGYRWFAGGKAR